MGLPTKDSAAPETEAPTATPLYTGSGSSPNLPPLPYPLGVVSEYTQHRTTIALRIRQFKSSFLGREFAVKDAITGNALFDVRGKTSFFQRKVLYDRTGKLLLEFHRYPFSVPKSYIGHEPDNKHKQLFMVQRKGSVPPKTRHQISEPGDQWGTRKVDFERRVVQRNMPAHH